MAVHREKKNPIITPEMIKPSRDDFEVVGSFNVAAVRKDDEIILLVRVAERPITDNPKKIERTAIFDPQKNQIVIKDFDRTDPANDFTDSRMTITPHGKFLTSLSHLRVARSSDGINFEIEESPAIFPATEYESFSIEDPRITRIGQTYYIDYVGVSPVGVVTILASTEDFKTFQRHGVIFHPDNKDVLLFPEKIGDKYYAIHRPVTPLFEKYEMWIAESPDLLCWGNHKFLMRAVPGLWENKHIGGGAPPVRTEHGWLEIYHGVDGNNRYCLGAVLLDLEQPWVVKARTTEPILEPETDYEKTGFFGNVVFTCGLLYEQRKLKIYYGVADTSTAYAEIPIEDVLNKACFLNNC